MLEASPDTVSSIADALRHHLHWQRHLLKRLTSRTPHAELAAHEREPRFLVLRPGDRSTVCTTDYLASGRCFGQKAAKTRSANLSPHDPHWDDIVIANRTDVRRLLPGLGNIAAALASSAVVAILSRRVLLCENWTVAGESFDAPLDGLLLGRSGWEPFLARAQAVSRAETFITSDDTSLSTALCSHDLRSHDLRSRLPPPEPAMNLGVEEALRRELPPTSARVWRIFSNQYYLPLLLVNPHHRGQLAAWLSAPNRLDDGATLSAGQLWAPLVQILLRPRPDLRTAVDSLAAGAPLLHVPSRSRALAPSANSSSMGISVHLRCMETLNGFCGARAVRAHADCAQQRLRLLADDPTSTEGTVVSAGVQGVSRVAASRSTRLAPPTVFVATMHARDRKRLEAMLQEGAGDNQSISNRGGGGGGGGAGDGVSAGSGRSSVRIAYASKLDEMAERVQTGVRRQEDGRILDTWLLSRGYEILLSPASTMSYLAMGLAPPDAKPITLRGCRPPPSTEPPFHLLQAALSSSASCRAMASEVASGLTASGEPAHGLSPRLRKIWNTSHEKW